MLQAIRERAQGIFAWVMLIAVGIPFALWGIQNYIDTGKESPAAVVGDREIFDRDVSRAYEQSLSNLVGLGDLDEKELRHEALERLISEEVIAQKVIDQSLTAGDAEVRGFIQTLPYFQTEGQFDKEKYKIMLSTQGMTPNQFVAQIRRALTLEQFQRGLLDTAFITSDQLENLLRLKNQMREVTYASIPIKPSSRNFTDAEIQAYYQAHVSEFRNPEKVSISYLMVSLDEMAKTTSLTDEALRKLYEEQKASFGTPERRKISHILVAVDGKNADVEQAALAKTQAIAERLAHGEDFAKLARENSADTVSAKNGGALGELKKDAQEDDFYKAAMALKLGEVSKPVKTSFGYELIKLTDWVPAKFKPYEEVKEELRKTAQHNAAEAKFYEVGQKLAEQSFEHPESLEPVAEQLNLKVQSTGLFTRDKGEGLASDDNVRKAAFSEDVLNGRNSDPVELGDDKALVLRVSDHELASDKPLSEVKTAILGRLRIQDAWEETQKRADNLLKQVNETGKPLSELAKSSGLTVVNAGLIRREVTTLPGDLVQAIFKSPRPQAGQTWTGLVGLSDGGQIVFTVLSAKDGEKVSKDPKEQAQARDFLSRSEAQREFGSFVAELRNATKVKLKQGE